MARRELGRRRLRKEDLGEFFDTYYKSVFNYVYYKTLNYSTADEVTSDVFFHVARSYESFDPARGSLNDWVFRIARNDLYSYFRRQRETVDIDAVAEGAFATEQDFGDPYDERGSAVRDMLALLNDEERELFYLKFWEELSNKEIAARLDMNASTVSTKLSRAVGRIRKAYPDFELEA